MQLSDRHEAIRLIMRQLFPKRVTYSALLTVNLYVFMGNMYSVRDLASGMMMILTSSVRPFRRLRVIGCRLACALCYSIRVDHLLRVSNGVIQLGLDAPGSDLWKAPHCVDFNGNVFGRHNMERSCEGLQQLICIASICQLWYVKF